MNCQVPTDRISILEKIARLTEIYDPSVMPIDMIQFYAANLGYSVGLSREDIPTNVESESDPLIKQANQNKYLRYMVSQLPEWYKIKTSRPSVQVMLYSFGLVGDIVYYYTDNYMNKLNKSTVAENTINQADQQFINTLRSNGYDNFEQIYDELCKLQYNIKEFKNIIGSGWIVTQLNSTSIKDDPSNIPDEYFPTPHFRIWFDILDSLASLTYSVDVKRNDNMVKAINAIRPINTVFNGVIAAMTVNATITRVPYVRMYSSLSLVSDVPADKWTIS